MGYPTLTVVPSNLKEAIDWLDAVKNNGDPADIISLGAAVHDLLYRYPSEPGKLAFVEEVKAIVKKFFEKPELVELEPIHSVLQRYYNSHCDDQGGWSYFFWSSKPNEPTNVVVDQCLTTDDVTEVIDSLACRIEDFTSRLKPSGNDVSAYDSTANWADSCDADERLCAEIFVGIAPLYYAGLRALAAICKTAHHVAGPIGVEGNKLGALLSHMGFTVSSSDTDTRGEDICKSLALPKETLNDVYDLAGFYAFC
ncbi:uncharacterized protein BcabD6B2_44730 [Babesia caballi]|uniref:Uncharacterized protein n=1 Tax=Babesia caballi TaxID=5871 RepID=A0AAV4LXZ1_BABCB|nr:hypothetical protein, conserved [Babesia caballi]